MALAVVVTTAIVGPLPSQPPAAASDDGGPLTGITTTSVDPGTRVLRANGDPLVVKGYNYFPNAIGEYSIADPFADTDQCARDADLLRGAGVTVVRIWLNFGRQPDLATVAACADGFAGAGIGIAWTIGQPVGLPTDIGWEEQFQLSIERAIENLGDHPATMFWLIGNEIELITGCEDPCRRAFFGAPGGPEGMLGRLADHTKARDPHHLVGASVSAARCFHWIDQANAPAVDVWGLNAYPSPPDFTRYCNVDFFQHLDDIDPRPKFFTEYGADRFRCAPAVREDGSGYIVSCDAPASGEDQDAQARWLASTWDSTAPHLATPSNPHGAVSGATVFFFADAWDNCTFFCVGSPATHEVTSFDFSGHTRSQPDGNTTVEWWGVAHAQPRGVTEPRVTTLAFDALAQRWSTVPPPTVTTGPAVFGGAGGCATPTVAWNTSEPGTSEVQLGVDGEKLDADGFLVSDDTIYRQVAHDTADVTAHRVTLPPLAPGVDYRVTVRTFTPDGRSVTAVPVDYRYVEGCPAAPAPQVGAPTASTSPQEDASLVVSATVDALGPLPLRCTVSHGDGSGVQPGSVEDGRCVGPPHRYADGGPYEVVVAVSDAEGTTGTASAVLDVAHVAPVVGPPELDPVPSRPRQSVVASADFADPGATDGPYTCAVDYGDGSGPQQGTVHGTTCTGPMHAYERLGEYTVRVLVHDADGQVGTGATITTTGPGHR